jgi:hypothetical protein
MTEKVEKELCFYATASTHLSIIKKGEGVDLKMRIMSPRLPWKCFFEHHLCARNINVDRACVKYYSHLQMQWHEKAS